MNEHSRAAEHGTNIRVLSSESDACIQRLEALEAEMVPVPEDEMENEDEASIMSFETAQSTRSTRDSIIDWYGRMPYRDIWSASDASLSTACEKKNRDSSASDLVEDYLSQTTYAPDDDRGSVADTDGGIHDSSVGTGKYYPVPFKSPQNPCDGRKMIILDASARDPYPVSPQLRYVACIFKLGEKHIC